MTFFHQPIRHLKTQILNRRQLVHSRAGRTSRKHHFHWEGNHGGNLQLFFLLQESCFFRMLQICAKNLGLFRDSPKRISPSLAHQTGHFHATSACRFSGLWKRFISRSTPLKVHKERFIRVKLLIYQGIG